MSEAEAGSPPLQELLGLLTRAREILERTSGAGRIERVALHLVDCAVDVSRLLTERQGLETAREALGSARSAVVAATCAVLHAHDREKALAPRTRT